MSAVRFLYKNEFRDDIEVTNEVYLYGVTCSTHPSLYALDSIVTKGNSSVFY